MALPMHPFRNQSLDRRTFLRGVGACLSLPWLEAMLPALPAHPLELPVRCLFLFAPNGQKMDDWQPHNEGANYELPFLLEPFAPHKSALTVFSGLAIDGGRAHGDGAGDHARAASSFLTCAHPVKTGGADIKVGVSADQVIAAELGARTRFPSLELGMERGAQAGICDSGYSCAYSNNIAWKTENTPVAKETEPRALFTRLFGDPRAAFDRQAAERERQREVSVLDAVLGDAKALAGTLGPQDRRKLDDYLQAVRELEQRLAKVDSGGKHQEVPAGLLSQDGFPAKLALMYELIALAFAADLTRTVTFMLGNGGSNRSYKFLDVPEGHHEMSHHGKKPEKLAGIRKINRFHTEQFAAFLARLSAHREGESNLLRQALVVYGSGIGDGDRHNHHDLPVLLLGNGGDQVKGGKHVKFAKETPMANLYLGVMHAMGVRRGAFADSTGMLLA